MTLSHPVRGPETSSSGDAYPVSLWKQRPWSDIFYFPVRRVELGVESNESFGEEEEEAAAPRGKSFSALTNRTCHLRRRRPEAESQHQHIFMRYDGVGKGPLTEPNGTGEAIGRRAKGDAKSRFGRRNWGRVSLPFRRRLHRLHQALPMSSSSSLATDVFIEFRRRHLHRALMFCFWFLNVLLCD